MSNGRNILEKYLNKSSEKLVRDKIPKILKEKGKEIKRMKVVKGEEYYFYLKRKLIEEVLEFLEEDKEEEIVDILEVIEAICKYKGWDLSEIERIKEEKARERGKFEKGIVIEF